MAAMEVVRSAGGMGGRVIGTAIAGAIAIPAAMSAMTSIGEYERGVRTKWGKIHRDEDDNPDPKILQPGRHYMFPGAHSIYKISLQDREDSLQEFPLDKGDAQYEVRGDVTWGVSDEGLDPYYAMFHADSIDMLREKVMNVAEWALGAALNEFDGDITQFQRHGKEIFKSAKEFANDGYPGNCLPHYGVELRALSYKAARSYGHMVLNSGGGPAVIAHNGNGSGPHPVDQLSVQ